MSQLQFFESQTLSATLVEAERVLASPSLQNLANEIPADAAAHLNDVLAELFADPRLADCVTVSHDVEAPEDADGFGWRLGRKVAADGKTQKARFYRFQSEWKTQAVSLVAVAIAIGLIPLNPLSGFAALPPTLTLLASAWDKFVTLQRPHDAHAIDAYEALVKAALESRRRGERAPTTDEIHAVTGNPELAITLAGLKRLKELELVDVVEWENLAGNYDAAGNRWLQRL
jgi:hypothetical protein